MDARHHPFDVISGSLIGILSAWGSYRQYFPPLSDFRAKGRAYPIRSWGTSLSKGTALPANGGYVPTPAQHDEEHSSQAAFVSGRLTPPQQRGQADSGNVFRDQISASQRQRRQAPTFGTVSSTYSGDERLPQFPGPQPAVPQHQPAESPYNTALPSSNPFTSGNQQGRRDDIWEESEDDGDAGYELEPQYTLSDAHQNQAGHFEPFRTQDTSYHGQALGSAAGMPLHAPQPAHTSGSSSGNGLPTPKTPPLVSPLPHS